MGTAAATPAQRATGLAAALGCGALVAVQSRVNGDLAARLHDGIAAAVISFGIGLIVLAVAAAVLPSVRSGLASVRDAVSTGRLRWWHLLGGACGALLVLSQGVTVPVIGVAVFSVAIVAGQSVSSLAVDRLGIGPTGHHPLTPARVIGAVLTVGAVLVAVSNQVGRPGLLALAALPALAGIGTSWQQAVNGRVRQWAGSALPATLVNFAAGMAALLITFSVDVAVRGWPTGALPHQPWLYVGGLIGVLFIAVSASVVRWTGVLLLGLATIAGQLLMATLIDFLAPGSAGGPGANTLLGIALTLVAVGIAALPTRRRPS
ncbi:DMT family transporter [Planosporangium mesophilum]|uniref:DMT family transporter n=1 Tax=Planosporangium mesophilum TaxID=689768 RepID=UPI00143C6C5B|nr:DMT family transporter [Planosporangium mesophilum]